MRPRGMQIGRRRADHREVMRLAGPILVVLLLLLALAPAASAHDEAEPNHRDTPADLAGADINRALAVAALASTVAPDLPQFLPTTWCGSRAHHRRHGRTPPSPRRRADQGRLRATRSDQPDDFATWKRRAADRRLAHRAVPGAADGRPARAALRHGHRVRPAVRRHPGRPPARATAAPTSPATTIDNFDAVADDVAPAGRRDRPRDVFVLADGTSRPDRARRPTASGASPRSRPTTAPAAATSPTRAA